MNLKTLFIFLAGITLLVAVEAQASPFITFANPLKTKSLIELIDNLLNFLFTLALIGAPILLVIAGVMFMTAAGNPSRISTARNMLMWTIIGFGVILLSRGLIILLQGILGVTS
ncbi:MAG: hypothetical protein AAB567_02045 [Patescibacteria group bacterium]